MWLAPCDWSPIGVPSSAWLALPGMFRVPERQRADHERYLAIWTDD
jgi:hypothetical protein